jgi:TRAP transporter TAXI family solute receptor
MGSNLSEFGHEKGRTMAAQALEITLGTATPGGGFPAFGEAFASTISDVEPSLRVACRATRGSAENIPLIESGALDLALVQGEALAPALLRGAQVKVLAAIYSQAALFCVHGASVHCRIADLAGRRVALGVPTSGLVLLARRVLESLDVEVDAVYLDTAGEGARLLRERRVEGLFGAGAGWPGFVELVRDIDVRFISPDDAEAAAILARHPDLRRVVLPAGSYTGQRDAIASVGSWSYILARPSLADDTAFRLAAALHRGHDLLASRLPAAREATLENTARVVAPELLHPGVARWLREAA